MYVCVSVSVTFITISSFISATWFNGVVNVGSIGIIYASGVGYSIRVLLIFRILFRYCSMFQHQFATTFTKFRGSSGLNATVKLKHTYVKSSTFKP